MIRSLHVKNFRCLRDVEIDFEPLTVLVGANASGKTAVLTALDPKALVQTHEIWKHGPGPVWVELAFTDQTKVAAELPTSTGNVKAAFHPAFARYTAQLLLLDLAQLRSPNLVQRQSQVARDGSNLSNLIGSLTRKQQGALAEQLCRLVPMFGDLDVQPTSNGQHQLRFQDRWNPSVWYQPSEVSDGTMVLTAYLALQYQDPPVDLVAIEDPERGLHPYLIGQLVELLRRLSRGELGGKSIQIVLATHSAELLDHVEPEEVRFLSRDASDGSVKVSRIDTASPDWRAAYREYDGSLGGAWLSGGLGGVPGTGTGG